MLCVPNQNFGNFSLCTLWLLLSNKKHPWLTGLQQYLFAIVKSAEEVLLKVLMFVARREQDTFKAMLIVEVVISLCTDGI